MLRSNNKSLGNPCSSKFKLSEKNNTKKPSNFDLLSVINNLRHLESSECGLWKTSSLVLDILIAIGIISILH